MTQAWVWSRTFGSNTNNHSITKGLLLELLFWPGATAYSSFAMNSATLLRMQGVVIRTLKRQFIECKSCLGHTEAHHVWVLFCKSVNWPTAIFPPTGATLGGRNRATTRPSPPGRVQQLGWRHQLDARSDWPGRLSPRPPARALVCEGFPGRVLARRCNAGVSPRGWYGAPEVHVSGPEAADPATSGPERHQIRQ